MATCLARVVLPSPHLMGLFVGLLGGHVVATRAPRGLVACFAIVASVCGTLVC